MTYLRRLLTKSRATALRLTARRLPRFALAETLVEESDESVFVTSPPAVPSLRQNDPLLASEMRRGPGAPVTDLRPPRDRANDGDRMLVSERKEPGPAKVTDALPDAQRPRRLKRFIGEHRRYPTAGQMDFRSEKLEGEQLLIVAEKPAGPTGRGIAARVGEPLVREIQPAVQRTAAEANSSTVVNVVIGRIDVRTAAATPAKEARAEPFRPRMSLDAYLGREGGAT